MSAVDRQPLGLRPRFALGFGGREQGSIIFRVTAGGLLEFARALQLLQGVEARGVEEAILSDFAARIGRDQRFADEVCDAIDDPGRTRIGGDGDRSFEREIASEHAEPAQDRALFFREQLIAPVQRSAERLVPGQSSAPAGRQKPEAIVEMRRQVPHTKDADTRRCQLERERDTVEPATNLQSRRHVRIGEGEPIHRRHRALVEQLHGRVAQRIAGGEIDRVRREFQRGQAMQRLALCPQRLSARGQNADAGRRLQHRLGQWRCRVDHVLAAVEHDQGSLVA